MAAKSGSLATSPSESKRSQVPFGHEKLDVYRLSIADVGWVDRLCQSLKGQQAHAKDQILRAAQSIPLNIAEGKGKATEHDRRRYFEIARGSALECAAAQDVLEICGALEASENSQAKQTLDRIVAMLTKLGQRGYSVQEDAAEYKREDRDADSDLKPS
ncbi:MAG: four helix bundle protein [Opitutae bacterium]|nr:four helix bundle protein [Opitutae bacterium]